MDDDIYLDTPRTAEEIARRAIALHCTIAAAHGVSKDDLTQWLKEKQLWEELTPRELAFFSQAPDSPQEVVWMTWLVEAQVALLWSIAKLDALPEPTGKCDTGLVVAAMPGLFKSTHQFIESAVLRSREEIEQEEANVYDIHCRVDQATRNGQKIPGGYEKSVVFFRHYGLSWVRGYCGQSWDEVTPDT
ncbi:DUF4272 domain-containing protein [Aeoliella sp.]|uniref:DUF4272 domain-containing protein n=1 Tax=Aeoliella sp. TaxID=2795800 RepID=UPI003CCB77CD